MKRRLVCLWLCILLLILIDCAGNKTKPADDLETLQPGQGVFQGSLTLLTSARAEGGLTLTATTCAGAWDTQAEGTLTWRKPDGQFEVYQVVGMRQFVPTGEGQTEAKPCFPLGDGTWLVLLDFNAASINLEAPLPPNATALVEVDCSETAESGVYRGRVIRQVFCGGIR